MLGMKREFEDTREWGEEGVIREAGRRQGQMGAPGAGEARLGGTDGGGGSAGADRAGAQVTETMKCLQEAARAILSK